MPETNLRINVEANNRPILNLIRDIGVLDQAELDSITAEATRLEASFESVGQTLQGVGSRINGLGRSLSVGITAPLAALGIGALTQAANIEQLEVRLAGLAGSAEAGAEALESLVDFTASTPFQLDDVANAGATLLSFGVEADSLIDQLRTLGDTAAGSGASLGELAGIYGRILTQGQLTGETLNQIGERGIPINRALAETLGVAESEIRNLVSTGAIGIPQLDAAFESLTTGSGAFANQLELQSRTLGGAFSTALDNVRLLLTDIGQGLNEDFNITGLLNQFTTFVNGLRDNFNNLDSDLRRNITGFLAFAAAIGPILLAVGSLATAFGTASRFLGPFISQVIASATGLTASGASFTQIAGALSRVAAGFATSAALVGVLITAFINIERRTQLLSRTFSSIISIIQNLFSAFVDVDSIAVSFSDAISFLGLAFGVFAGVIENALIFSINGLLLSISSLLRVGLFPLIQTLGALNSIPGVRNLVPDSVIANINNLDESLRNLQVDSLNSIADDTRTFDQILDDQLSARTIEVDVEPRTNNINNNQGSFTDQIQAQIDSQDTVEATIDIVTAFDGAIDTAIADIQQQVLEAQRTLVGDELDQSLTRINDLGNQSLTAIRDSFISVLDQISDPQLLLRAEQAIADINSRIAIDPGQTNVDNLLGQASAATDANNVDNVIADSTLTGQALETEIQRINSATSATLTSIRDQLVSVLEETSDPQIAAGLAVEIDSINDDLDRLDTSGAMQELTELQQIGNQALGTLQNGFNGFFDSVIGGSEDANDAIEDFARNVASQLASQALTSALTQVFSTGGAVAPAPTGILAMNTGGRVVGPGSGTSDSILARLSNGEFVQRAAAVRSFGSEFMEAVNNIDPSRALGILSERLGTEGFASGGIINSLGSFTDRLSNISLPRFETGGIVNSTPQMLNNMNVSVNVVNNGGTQQTARTEQRFDGQGAIVDVILEDMRAGGRISRGMRSAFGLTRSAV